MYLLDQPSIGDACRLWAYPLHGMNVTTWLWRSLHDLFETNDGSLPEICVKYGDPNAVACGYAILRKRAETVVSERACFWSVHGQEERSIDSVENPAALVLSGEANPFHVVFGGIGSQDATIPDLGVYVFQEELALDYRMGSEWGSDELCALFELLGELTSLDPHSSLSLEDGVLPEVASRFQDCWSRWLANHAV
jgi:hypothetical protein